MATGEVLLTRSRLRDVIILLCLGSSFFFAPSPTGLVLSFFVLVLGCFVHILAKGVLVRNEVLCKEGVYSICRHPYYLANYLVDTSFCLASGNIYLLLCYPFLFFWSYGPTLRKEERHLLERHGEAVVEQIMDVPPLYPDRLSMANLDRLFRGFAWARISPKEVARNVRFFVVWLLLCAIALSSWPDSILGEHYSLAHVVRGWHLLPVAACIAALGLAAGLIMKRGRGT